MGNLEKKKVKITQKEKEDYWERGKRSRATVGVTKRAKEGEYGHSSW
jgi:hypothetical protein